jgi:hypothetical protein
METSHACSPTSASALTLVVSRECVTTSKSSPAFGTGVWAFASVQLSVSLQVMESAKAGLAGLANERLFLTVGEEMALEIVLPSKLGCAVGAAVFFRRRGARTASVVTGGRQAQSSTRVVDSTGGHGIRKGFVAILVDLRVLSRARSVSTLHGLVHGTWTGDRGCMH